MNEKPTKNEQAYEKLRKMILGGKFAAGGHWTVRSLAGELGVSAITVNHALQRLQQDGLLEIRPQSGIFLRYMDKKQRCEFEILRQSLEVQAARLLAMNIESVDIKPLRQIARQIHDALEREDFSTANELDHEFHTMMLKLANCDPLTEAFERVISICMLVPDLSGQWRQWREYNNGKFCSHLYVVEQIESGNPGKAEKAIRNHVPNLEKLLVSELRAADALNKA